MLKDAVYRSAAGITPGPALVSGKSKIYSASVASVLSVLAGTYPSEPRPAPPDRRWAPRDPGPIGIENNFSSGQSEMMP